MQIKAATHQLTTSRSRLENTAIPALQYSGPHLNAAESKQKAQSSNRSFSGSRPSRRARLTPDWRSARTRIARGGLGVVDWCWQGERVKWRDETGSGGGNDQNITTSCVTKVKEPCASQSRCCCCGRARCEVQYSRPSGKRMEIGSQSSSFLC